jgi:hypothetical protein
MGKENFNAKRMSEHLGRFFTYYNLSPNESKEAIEAAYLDGLDSKHAIFNFFTDGSGRGKLHVSAAREGVTRKGVVTVSKREHRVKNKWHHKK